MVPVYAIALAVRVPGAVAVARVFGPDAA